MSSSSIASRCLGEAWAYYDIQRPERNMLLPNILSMQEVETLIGTPKNLKRKAIQHTVYSAGLRLQEVLNLRTEEAHSDDGYRFIKAAKGEMDRKTVLSPLLLGLLRSYDKAYRPSYWLFEGQHGQQYTISGYLLELRSEARKCKKIGFFLTES